PKFVELGAENPQRICLPSGSHAPCSGCKRPQLSAPVGAVAWSLRHESHATPDFLGLAIALMGELRGALTGELDRTFKVSLLCGDRWLGDYTPVVLVTKNLSPPPVTSVLCHGGIP
ncbi:Hypothetical predicted protein, partial [Marmota monax]